ncbi:hypothetical protein Poly30_36940 [Planctomycetes bacterium Poly30]|uniref:Uncharacterized protein n=1 Tax=Saltatorellus ferox TaxID=2528018 RepID=A0A518EVT2_9BACT|nr:hypothetical protein Poly30_36940 [Planctomycetes bacterium Poly30]
MQLALLALAALPPTGLQRSSPVPFSISHATDRHAVVHHDLAADGTHWLRGRIYKASADATGLAFHPFLGSDAPRNFPVKLQLLKITGERGSLELEGEAQVTRMENRIVLDRGGVQVRYDATPDQIEQSFLFDVPAGSGALTLELAVETELSVKEHRGGFLFSHEYGGVSYGATTAIDARGQRVDVPATWVDGEIHLTVPAAFLAEAESPILVDPILSTFTVGAAATDLGAPDLVYAGANVGFHVVYEESFSATDVDIYAALVAPDGTVSAGAYVEQTARSWRGPRIATTSSLFYLLVVADAPSVAVPGSRDIVARLREPNGAFQPAFTLKSATSTFSCTAPAVAGDLYYQAFSFCIAYNRDYGTHRDVHALLSPGTPPGPNQIERAVAASPTEDMSAPTITRATGLYADIDWVIAWAGRDLGSGASRVQATRYRYDLNQAVGPRTVAPPTTSALYFDVQISDTTDRFPLDGDRSYYVITYDDRPSNVSDAFVALYSGTSVYDTIELQVAEHADRAPNQDDVVIATGPQHFMLGYLENGHVFVTTIQPTFDSFGIIERRLHLAGPNVVPGSLAALGQLFEFTGSVVGRSLFLWSDASGPSTEIRGAFVTLPDERNSSGKQYCYGEPNSTGQRGFLYGIGSRIPGFDSELRVESLPPNNFGYFLASLSQGDIPNVGGSQGTLCVSGSVGRFGIFQVSASGTYERMLDTNQIPQPTGPVMSMAGQTWNFQVWHRDSVAGVATSNFTNGTTIQFR